MICSHYKAFFNRQTMAVTNSFTTNYQRRKQV